MATSAPADSVSPKLAPVVLLIGAESVGKTELAAGLSGRAGQGFNFRGSTISCQRFNGPSATWIDTPGLLHVGESASSALTMAELTKSDNAMLVLSWPGLTAELATLLPLVEHKLEGVVITHADRCRSKPALAAAVNLLAARLTVPVTAVDARNLTPEQKEHMGSKQVIGECGSNHPSSDRVLRPSAAHAAAWLRELEALWQRDPANAPAVPRWRKPFVMPFIGPALGLLLLLVPAFAGVLAANALAERAEPLVDSWLEPLLDAINGWTPIVSQTLAGDYGIVAMGPFLLLYALPTVVFFALFLSLYKVTGLIDLLATAVEPWMRRFGLSGRDLVRVVMGFGCNVPAVVQTRACAGCARGACVSAISFGSACSYQLPATLAVFGAAGLAWLALPYLLVLLVTTLIYVRATTPAHLRSRTGSLLPVQPARALQPPRLKPIARDAASMLTDFLRLALPVFLIICVASALLAHFGVLDLLSSMLAPAMSLFRLPPEAAIAVILGSVRKDGIAIGLLGGEDGLKVMLTDPGQVLAIVYFAGVALPCLVTLWTIGREMSWRFASRMAGRQLAAAALFTFTIAWLWPR